MLTHLKLAKFIHVFNPQPPSGLWWLSYSTRPSLCWRWPATAGPPHGSLRWKKSQAADSFRFNLETAKWYIQKMNIAAQRSSATSIICTSVSPFQIRLPDDPQSKLLGSSGVICLPLALSKSASDHFKVWVISARPKPPPEGGSLCWQLNWDAANQAWTKDGLCSCSDHDLRMSSFR